MANEQMEAAWNGDEGEEWAEKADRYDAVSPRAHVHYRASFKVAPSSTVLDVGCGSGKFALELAQECLDGSVLGIDLSSQMLDVAAKRAAAAGLTNVSFVRGDAQLYDFAPASFDLAISSFGAMFFDDPTGAFTNIANALKPGGRLSLFAWRTLQENEWLMLLRGALALGRELGLPPIEAPTPFSLSNEQRTTDILSASGLTDVAFTAVDEPMILGADADDAFDFIKGMGITRGLTDDLDADQKRQALDNLRKMLVEHDTNDGVLLPSAAWIITARKPTA